MPEEPKVTRGVVFPVEVSRDTIKGVCIDESGPHMRVYRRAEEGQPINGDVTILTGRQGSPVLLSETLHTGKGPARVNSEAYREGYDRIFGKRAPVAEA